MSSDTIDKDKKPAKTRRRRLSYKLICLLVDAAAIVAVGAIISHLNCSRSKLHYDIDRTEFPLKGIDVSAHNGEIDFVEVKADTVSFVLIKSTEGTDFCDANFNRNYKSAVDAGLKVGAYHYFRFDTPGETQACHFLYTVSGRDFDLPLAVDVERSGNASEYSTDNVKQQLRRFIDTVNAAGYPVMIYTNKNDYHKFIAGNFADVPLWICSLSSSQPSALPWTYWQHSHAGHVKGVRGHVDINTFKGDTTAMAAHTSTYTVAAQ